MAIGYFLLGDSLNTTVTVIGTLQNSIVSYNTLELTYLLIVGIAAQVSLIPRAKLFQTDKSLLGCWHIRILDNPATLQARNQNYVQRRRRWNHPT